MKPLEGIKVIELAQVVAAPTVGRVMSDFGADVIKIEPLGGDVLRGAGIAYALPIEEDDNPLFTIMTAVIGKLGMQDGLLDELKKKHREYRSQNK